MVTQLINPTFLFGMQRSGTNMVVWTLDKMKDILLYNENNSDAFSKFELISLENTLSICNSHPNKKVIFKCLQDSYQISVMLEEFPDSKALFILRNYDAVINSQLMAFKEEKELHFIERVTKYIDKTHKFFALNVESSLKDEIHRIAKNLYTPEINRASLIGILWIIRNTIFLNQNFHKHPRVKFLKYEEIIAAPGREFESMCEFIDIPFNKEFVQNIKSNKQQVFDFQLDLNVRKKCEHLWQELNKHIRHALN